MGLVKGPKRRFLEQTNIPDFRYEKSISIVNTFIDFYSTNHPVKQVNLFTKMAVDKDLK